MDVVIETGLVDMYAKNGNRNLACQVFHRMTYKNVISWGALISSFAQNGFAGEALGLLIEMQEHLCAAISVMQVFSCMAVNEIVQAVTTSIGWTTTSMLAFSTTIGTKKISFGAEVGIDDFMADAIRDGFPVKPLTVGDRILNRYDQFLFSPPHEDLVLSSFASTVVPMCGLAILSVKSFSATQHSGKNHSNYSIGLLLKETLLNLGPTLITVGQSLSTRPDIIGPEICKAVSELHAQLPPFPRSVAMAIIEEACGCPVQEVFSYITNEPIAAASFRQVYCGSTLDGQPVAIHIPRPNLLHVVIGAIYLLHFGLRVLEKVAKRWRNLSLYADELGKGFTGALDYTIVVANAFEFLDAHARFPFIYVPKVFGHLSRKKVLTMEWLTSKHPNALVLVSILHIVTNDWASLVYDLTKMDVVSLGSNLRLVNGIPEVKFSRVLGVALQQPVLYPRTLHPPVLPASHANQTTVVVQHTLLPATPANYVVVGVLHTLLLSSPTMVLPTDVDDSFPAIKPLNQRARNGKYHFRGAASITSLTTGQCNLATSVAVVRACLTTVTHGGPFEMLFEELSQP